MGALTHPPPWPGTFRHEVRTRLGGIRTPFKMGLVGANSRAHRALIRRTNRLFLEADALEALIEAGELTARIEEALLTAGPSRV